MFSLPPSPPPFGTKVEDSVSKASSLAVDIFSGLGAALLGVLPVGGNPKLLRATMGEPATVFPRRGVPRGVPTLDADDMTNLDEIDA